MKILVKPHLAYWRDYAWRGDIRYETEQEWDRFFTTYTRWIAQLASFSRGADAFVVGTELGGTTHHEGRWRQTIEAVRGEFDGPLTYAANWDAYQRVGFWDALDLVGIQAYFPLLDGAPEDGQLPSQQVLDAGWQRVMQQVAAFSKAVERPVVFTETGYNNAPTAAHEPWGLPDARERRRTSDSLHEGCPARDRSRTHRSRCVSVEMVSRRSLAA